MPRESRPRRLLLRAVSLGSGAALLGAAGCSSSSTTKPLTGTTVEDGGHEREGGVQGLTTHDAGVQGLTVDGAGVGLFPADGGVGKVAEDGGEQGTTIRDAGVVGTIVHQGG